MGRLRTNAIAAGMRMSAGAVLLATSGAAGQCNSVGPDAIVGVLGSSVANYNSVNGVDAFSVAASLCNVGNANLQFNANTNQHPLITQNLYRYDVVEGAGRFEQVGMSWCFNTFFPLPQGECCVDCQPGALNELGVHCSSAETAAIMGTISGQSPRHQVNAATGVFAYPPANPAQPDALARRLRVALSDIEPVQHAGARYFVEHMTVSSHDAGAGNGLNNASYREAVMTGTASNRNLAMTGTIRSRVPAINAWREADPDVTIAPVDVPGDGRMYVACRVTALAGGVWRYEYAIENFNSDRAARLFSVPGSSGIAVTNVGFHDVHYHSGDGPGNVNIDGTDWASSVGDAVEWSTATFAQNPSANALRWGTLYNFRFDTAVAPEMGTVTIGLFKPGASEAVIVSDVLVPGVAACAADWNESGNVDSQDFFDFLSALFAGDADFNGDLVTNSQDFFDFVAAFFVGCG